MYNLNCPECRTEFGPTILKCERCNADTKSFADQYYKNVVTTEHKVKKIGLSIIFPLWIIIILFITFFSNSGKVYQPLGRLEIVILSFFVAAFLGFGLGLILGGLYILIINLTRSYQQKQSINWDETEGTVVSSTVKIHYNNGESHTTPLIFFRFTIDSSDFIGFVEDAKWDKLGERIEIIYYKPEIDKLKRKNIDKAYYQSQFERLPLWVKNSFPSGEFPSILNKIVEGLQLVFVGLFTLAILYKMVLLFVQSMVKV